LKAFLGKQQFQSGTARSASMRIAVNNRGANIHI